MKKPRVSPKSPEPDTLFGTAAFTAQDLADRQEFIAATRNTPENRAAVAALNQRASKVATVVSTSFVQPTPARVGA